MNRPIEFRAWDIENKIMIQDVSHMQRDGIIVMQYTGLKDKNGVKIFEEDIVQDTEKLGYKGTVYWEKGSFVVNRYKNLGIFDLFAEEGRIEIIGNIYQNPELLENN